MKALIKRLTSNTFKLLPRRAKRLLAFSVAPALEPADRYELMASIAESVNVERLSVSGSQGVFESLSSDNAVLKDYAVQGAWAGGTMELIKSVFFESGGGTYIDIGANIGLTVIPIAKLNNVKCYAFEPEPENFCSLLTNAVNNGIEGNLHTYRLALSDYTGSATFSLAKGNLGDHRLKAAHEPFGGADIELKDRKMIEVRVEPLDALNLEIKDPLVVKIDTQGAEPLVLRGGKNTIGRANLLIMEFSPYHILKFQKSADDILEFLNSHFRNIFVAQEGQLNLSTGVGKAEITKLRQFFIKQAQNGDRDYFDIIATK